MPKISLSCGYHFGFLKLRIMNECKNYTLEDCISAKNELIKLGHLKESEIFLATSDDEEIGYLINEPMIFIPPDEAKSVLQFYNEYQQSLNFDEDEFLEFHWSFEDSNQAE